jgi:hypothetical protein
MINRTWTKSTYTNQAGGECVECRTEEDRVLLRDTKNRERGHLSFPLNEWQALITAIQHREL